MNNISLTTERYYEAQKPDTSFNNFANPEHFVLPFLIDILPESVRIPTIQQIMELRRCYGKPRIEGMWQWFLLTKAALGQPIVAEEGTYPFGWLPESAQHSCDFLFNGIKSLPDRIGNLTLDPIPQALHWVQFGMQGS